MLEVTSIDVANDLLIGVWSTTHSYAADGTFSAGWDECCRISDVGGGNYTVLSNVTVDSAEPNQPPTSTLAPVVQVANNSMVSFQIPAVDPESSSLTFTLNNAAAGLPTVPNLAVSSTGLLTWDLTATSRSTGDLDGVQLLVSDGTQTIPLDFILEVVSASNTPPTVITNPSGPFSVAIGQTISFDLTASDVDGDITALQALNAPAGLTLSPFTQDSSTTRTVTWTPTAAQAGVSLVNFQATDDGGAQTTLTVNLTVTGATTDIFIDGNGDLMVVDAGSGDTADTITVSGDGTTVTIFDPNNTLTAGNGATQVNSSTVTVPIASINSKIILDLLDGDDTVTVDFSSGAIGKLVEYVAGTGTTDSDKLEVTGGQFDSVVFDYDDGNTTGDEFAGDVTLLNSGVVAEAIRYTETEPVIFTSGVNQVTANLTSAADVATLSIDTTTMGNLLLDAATFEATSFTAPTGAGAAIFVNGLGGDDELQIYDIQSLQDSTSFELVVDGGADTDIYRLRDATVDGFQSLGVAALESGEKLFALTPGSGSAIATLAAKVSGALTSEIHVNSDAVLGDGSAAGFSQLGLTHVHHDRTLTISDSSTAELGVNTDVEGILSLDGGATDVSIDANETLFGDGIVQADVTLNSGTVSGDLTVAGELNGAQAAGGIVSAGNSPGVINAGDLTLNSGDVFAVEIDGDAGPGVAGGHDLTNVAASFGGSGAVVLGGATLDLSTVAVELPFDVGDSITIIDNDGVDAVVGTFFRTDAVDGTSVEIEDGDVILLGGQLFEISYAGGDGNDVTLTVRAAAQVEFDDVIPGSGTADSEEAEDVSAVPTSSLQGPTLVVRGDLRGFSEADRTVEFSVPTGVVVSSISSAAAVVGTGAEADVNAVVVVSFTFPEADFTAVDSGRFNLIESGNIQIVDDGLVEGPEDFEIVELTSIPVALGGEAADADADGDVNPGTIHTIIDNEFAEWSVTQTSTQETDGISEGAIATYTVALSGAFQGGENAIVTISLDDIDTDSDDYSGFLDAITDATGANYTGPGTLVFDGVDTLTYTADADGDSLASFTFDVAIEDDSLVEGAEDYSIVLSNPTSDTGADIRVDDDADSMPTDGENTVTTTINDNDFAEWNLTQATSPVTEGGTVDYTFSLVGTDQAGGTALFQAGETATVDISVTDISTTLGADYPSPVAAINAAVAAWNTANSPANGMLSTSFTGGAAPVVLTYTAGDGAGGATALVPDLVVNVLAIDDSNIEGTENVEVSIANPGTTTGADVRLLGDDGTGTMVADITVNTEITDNDFAEWNLTQATTPVVEGDTVDYTFSLVGTDQAGGAALFQAGETATVDISVTDISTTLGADYPSPVAAINAAVAAWNTANSPANGTLSTSFTGGAAPVVLTYTAGDGAGGATALVPDLVVNVLAIDDSNIEGTENVEVSIANPGTTTGADVRLLGDDGTGTMVADITVNTEITDNDFAEWNLTQATTPVVEGDTVDYTFSLVGTDQAGGTALFQAGETATVDISVTDISTTLGADFPSPVAAINAAVAAWNTANSPANGTLSTSFTGGAAPVVLTYTAGDGAGGATALVPDLVVNVLAIDDSNIEGTENVEVSIANPGTTTGADVRLLGDDGTGTMVADITVNTEITDNDFAEWNLTQATTPVVEGDTVDYTFSLVGTDQAGGAALFQSGETATVDISVTDISTTLGADYPSPVAAINAAVAAWNTANSPANGTLSTSFTGGAAPVVLTYTAGDGAGGATALVPDLVVNVLAIDDSNIEGTENVEVSIANPGTTTGADVRLLGDDGTGTMVADITVNTEITDNDFAEWNLTQATTPVVEGDTVDYTFSLVGTDQAGGTALFQAGETATVDISVTDISTTLGADFPSPVAAINAAVAAWNTANSPANGTLSTSFTGGAAPVVLTYTAGDGAGGATALVPDLVVNVLAIDDSNIEGTENVEVSIANPGTTTGADVRLLGDDGTGTMVADITVNTEITDNDFAEWNLTQATSPVTEGGTVDYTFSLVGTDQAGGTALFQAGETATVDISVTDISTTLGADYPSPVAAIMFAVVDWNSNNSPDNGALSLSFAGGDAPVVLTYTAGDGAGNPTALVPDLVVNVLAIDDSSIEGDEDVEISIANAGSTTGADVRLLGDTAATPVAEIAVTTTITDNDTANWTLVQEDSGAENMTDVDEGDTAVYTLTLDGTDGATTIVGTTDAAVQSGDNASITITLGLLGPTSLNDFDEFTELDMAGAQSMNETNPLALAIQDAVDAYNAAGGGGVGSLLRSPGDDNSFEFTIGANGGEVTYHGDSMQTACLH